jgi:hypothetical protein
MAKDASLFMWLDEAKERKIYVLMIFLWMFLVRVMFLVDMGILSMSIMCQTSVPIYCLFLS